MSTVKEDLLKAADIIDECGWCQGNYTNELGQLCMLAALETATMAGDLHSTIDAVKAHVGARYLVEWNDTPGRTKDEVLAALRAAAEVAS